MYKYSICDEILAEMFLTRQSPTRSTHNFEIGVTVRKKSLYTPNPANMACKDIPTTICELLLEREKIPLMEL